MTKIVNMKEEKIHLLRDLTNFNEISRKNTTYDNTKSDKKTKLNTLFKDNIFWNIISGLKHEFFEWNFSISVC